jgi:DNA primase
MAGRISQKDIEEIRQRTNIADVVGEYVQLKNAGGGELKGRCPFHDEKSPSFTVSPSKGVYYCFGCQEKGNLFDFVAKIDSLSFRDVAEKLAARLGMTLTLEAGNSSDAAEYNQRARVLEANKAAAEFFRSQFDSDEAAPGRELLLKRGFDSAACEPFGIGWAPKGWSGLSDHLKSKGFTNDELVTAGLASKSERGVFDKFRGRVIWPIRDSTNAVIGFGARKIFEDDTGPKYLNSSETPVYHKSRVLYGIDLAKKDMAKLQQVVVVEGYTDVMACHLAGVTTAVATCGTAFGDEHIRMLNRILSSDPASPAQVIFNFDPDEAGQKAAMRAFNDASKFNAQTFMAIGPDGLDPSDLRTQRGDQAVRDMIEAKKPLLEFAIGRSMNKFDLATREGQVGAARAAAMLLAQIDDLVMRGVYERFVADATNLERSDVALLVQQVAQKDRRAGVAAMAVGPNSAPTQEPQIPTDSPEPEVVDIDDPSVVNEKWLVIVLGQLPDACSLEDFARIGKANFSQPWFRDIARAIYQVRTSQGTQGLFAAVEGRLDDQLGQVFTKLMLTSIPANDDASRQKFAEGVIGRALEKAIEYEKNALRAKRRSAEALDDSTSVTQIDVAIGALDAEIHALRRSRA